MLEYHAYMFSTLVPIWSLSHSFLYSFVYWDNANLELVTAGSGIQVLARHNCLINKAVNVCNEYTIFFWISANIGSYSDISSTRRTASDHNKGHNHATHDINFYQAYDVSTQGQNRSAHDSNNSGCLHWFIEKWPCCLPHLTSQYHFACIKIQQFTYWRHP